MWGSELGYRISLISGISFGIQTNDESRNLDSFPSQARHRRLAMRHDETITWQLGIFFPPIRRTGVIVQYYMPSNQTMLEKFWTFPVEDDLNI